MNLRIDRLREWMKQQQIGAVFVTTPTTVGYFTGFFSNPHERLMGCLITLSGKPTLIVPLLDAQKARALGTADVVAHRDSDDAVVVFRRHYTDVACATSVMAIEKSHMTVARFEAFSKELPRVTWVAADEALLDLRMKKDAEELGLMRYAAKLADEAMAFAASKIAAGRTEAEIVSEIEQFVASKGADKMAFETMVLTGTKCSLPHGTPGDQPIQEGDLVIVDLGIVWKHYCSDITRTFAVGIVTDQQRAIYETVRHANEAAIQAVRPGVSAGSIDQTARQVIQARGYGAYFTHRVGHGLGIDIHEAPSMHGENHTTLQSGMTFTIEPGIYLPDVSGVRIEDDVCVTDEGVEVLTSYPKELQIL